MVATSPAESRDDMKPFTGSDTFLVLAPKLQHAVAGTGASDDERSIRGDLFAMMEAGSPKEALRPEHDPVDAPAAAETAAIWQHLLVSAAADLRQKPEEEAAALSDAGSAAATALPGSVTLGRPLATNVPAPDADPRTATTVAPRFGHNGPKSPDEGSAKTIALVPIYGTAVPAFAQAKGRTATAGSATRAAPAQAAVSGAALGDDTLSDRFVPTEPGGFTAPAVFSGPVRARVPAPTTTSDAFTPPPVPKELRSGFRPTFANPFPQILPEPAAPVVSEAPPPDSPASAKPGPAQPRTFSAAAALVPPSRPADFGSALVFVATQPHVTQGIARPHSNTGSTVPAPSATVGVQQTPLVSASATPATAENLNAAHELPQVAGEDNAAAKTATQFASADVLAVVAKVAPAEPAAILPAASGGNAAPDAKISRLPQDQITIAMPAQDPSEPTRGRELPREYHPDESGAAPRRPRTGSTLRGPLSDTSDKPSQTAVPAANRSPTMAMTQAESLVAALDAPEVQTTASPPLSFRSVPTADAQIGPATSATILKIDPVSAKTRSTGAGAHAASTPLDGKISERSISPVAAAQLPVSEVEVVPTPVVAPATPDPDRQELAARMSPAGHGDPEAARLLAQQMSAQASGHVSPSAPAVAADHGPAISRQIAEAAHHLPNGPVELTLSPEGLGRVRLTLATSDSGISVSVHAERPETLDLIRRSIDHLARDFRDLGYANTTFTFGDRPQNGQAYAQTQAPVPQPIPEPGQPPQTLPQPDRAPRSGAPIAACGLDLRL